MSDTPPDESTTDGPDYRQLSLVAFAAFALVLAAFFAPAGSGLSGPDVNPNAPTPPNPPDAEANPDFEGDPDSLPDANPDEIPDIDIDWRGLLEWFEFGGDPGDPGDPRDGEPNREPSGQLPESACSVWLDGEPTPGTEVTATIRDGRDPVTGIPVWYNDQFVGETNEAGEVTGEVPYVKELAVRIETDDHPECAAVGSQGQSVAGSVSGAAFSSDTGATVVAGASAGGEAALAVVPATGAAASSEVGVPLRAGVGTPVSSDGALAMTRQDAPLAMARQETPGEDGTVTYDVAGEVEITLHGQPDPGATIPVEATIEDVPMAEAMVSVDGETVAETDANGTATIEIPDDGTDSFELGVARGDFSGTTTVDVRLLEVSLSPEGIAPIPGSPGVVEATIADEPVTDAEVRIGGELVGTTDDEGRLPISFPLDPTTSITVSTADRTASVTLAGTYGGVALAVAIAIVALSAVAYRTHGARGAGVVLGTTAAALTVLTVEAFYGRIAGLAALLVVAAIVLGTGYRRSDRTIPDERPDAGSALQRFVERVVTATLALVALLERAVDRVRARLAAVRRWASSLPRSGTALGRRLASWLAALPGRALERGRRELARLRRLPLGTVVFLLGSVPTVVGGYVVDGRRGAVIVAGALAVAGLLYWTREDDLESASDDTDEPVEPTVGATAPEPDDDSSEQRTFRELWRAFARQVAPRRWHRHTPGEIQRTALEQGYPDRPVGELTTLFREVEYGGRPLSSGRRDRADEAYGELVDARNGDGEEPSDESSDDGTTETNEATVTTDANETTTADDEPTPTGDDDASTPARGERR